MGGGDEDHDIMLECSSSSSSEARLRIAQSPILLLVCFHKAMQAELADLRDVTAAVLDGGFRGRAFVLELLRRFEFLKLAYKHHSTAEDEVVFLALDGRTKNIACTYSLEHRNIDGLFDSIFNRLDVLLEESEDVSKEFQELMFSIGTLQSFICLHMLKEEEHVFPLLLQQFSPTEQAALVWQFLCSIPLVLLEDFLPWMISRLQNDEKEEVIRCIKEIVPDEKHLQEVVSSWLANKGNKCEARHSGDEEFGDMKKLLKSHSPKRFFEENWKCMKEVIIQTDTGYNPVDGLHLWHRAIRVDLKKIMGELYQLRSSINFLNIDSTVVQLKFLADVLTFYSNALERLFHPVLNEIVNCCPYPSIEKFPDERLLESLQNLLYCGLENVTPLGKFVEKLCREFQCLVVGVDKHFAFHETEVFPIIRKNCSHEMQQQLVYVSLYIMPLGLLKCVTTWFSASLSEDESRSILSSTKQRDFLVNESFVSLLHEWFHIGHSGETSTGNFQEDLQQIFKSRCTFLCNQSHAGTTVCSVSSIVQHRGVSNTTELISSTKGETFMPYFSSFASDSSAYSETSNSRGINLQVYFSGMKKSYHIPEDLGEKLSGYGLHESKPIDLLFFFHKALKKDLEYLVVGSAELAENAASLTDFCRRFNLIRFLHQIHSEGEDEVAFPALEAKGKCQNISQSYTMDHKLEVELFQELSLILDEMCKLQFSISMVDSNIIDQMLPKYHQLCMRLHGMCKTMCKLLTDHIHGEEVELWPLFRECFSIEEQERIMGCILGRTEATILQDMIPWQMESLTPGEQHAMISIWHQVTRNTMFFEWLKEWWEGYDAGKVIEESSLPPPKTGDPLEVESMYLHGLDKERSVCNKSINFCEEDSPDTNTLPLQTSEAFCHQCPTESGSRAEGQIIYESNGNAIDQINDPGQHFQASHESNCCEPLQILSQEDLLTAISKISRDSSLDPQNKPYMMQNLLSSPWRVRRHSQLTSASNAKAFPGQHPSYQDPFGLRWGCKHYKRSCKLVAPCCNQLYTCIRCHDEMAGHIIDRRSVIEMMCMKCLKIQPVGPTCSTPSCSDLSMARYFCKICKIFEDERMIYHCPYCNLCRVGKGLGIDYFHCMTCNACMACSLFNHTCREKSFMDNCPICHEDIFSSISPVKALPCGHSMHSTCFQAYTITKYTCPICCKSLGDMQMLFGIYDALLAEETLPDGYSGRTQAILCNDCEEKGTAPFHWRFHKCSSCGSYNTRLL